MDFPVRHLDNIAVACKPDMPLPAGDERYCRLDELRQSGGLSQLKAEMWILPEETNLRANDAEKEREDDPLTPI